MVYYSFGGFVRIMGWCTRFKENIKSRNLRYIDRMWVFNGTVITQCPWCNATLETCDVDYIEDRDGNIYI